MTVSQQVMATCGDIRSRVTDIPCWGNVTMWISAHPVSRCVSQSMVVLTRRNGAWPTLLIYRESLSMYLSCSLLTMWYVHQQLCWIQLASQNIFRATTWIHWFVITSSRMHGFSYVLLWGGFTTTAKKGTKVYHHWSSRLHSAGSYQSCQPEENGELGRQCRTTSMLCCLQ